MRKSGNMKSKRQIVIVTLAFALFFGPAVRAHDGASDDLKLYDVVEKVESNIRSTLEQIVTVPSSPESDDKKKSLVVEIKNQLEAKKAERQAAVDDKKAELTQKLDDSKKKICEKNQAKLNEMMGNMDRRRQVSFNRITAISESAQAFYAKKGLSATNYDAIVGAVNTTKAAANSSLQAQLAVPNLNCTSDHPRLDIEEFKSKRLDSIDAMKAYRDAVKALLAAIKTASKEDTASGGNT